MKKIAVLLITLTTSFFIYAQDLAQFHLYKPDENAEQQISRGCEGSKGRE